MGDLDPWERVSAHAVPCVPHLAPFPTAAGRRRRRTGLVFSRGRLPRAFCAIMPRVASSSAGAFQCFPRSMVAAFIASGSRIPHGQTRSRPHLLGQRLKSRSHSHDPEKQAARWKGSRGWGISCSSRRRPGTNRAGAGSSRQKSVPVGTHRQARERFRPRGWPIEAGTPLSLSAEKLGVGGLPAWLPPGSIRAGYRG